MKLFENLNKGFFTLFIFIEKKTKNVFIRMVIGPNFIPYSSHLDGLVNKPEYSVILCDIHIFAILPCSS